MLSTCDGCWVQHYAANTLGITACLVGRVFNFTLLTFCFFWFACSVMIYFNCCHFPFTRPSRLESTARRCGSKPFSTSSRPRGLFAGGRGVGCTTKGLKRVWALKFARDALFRLQLSLILFIGCGTATFRDEAFRGCSCSYVHVCERPSDTYIYTALFAQPCCRAYGCRYSE